MLVYWEAKTFIFVTKNSEELSQLLFLELEALILFLGELFPYFHEADLILFEILKHVFFRKVIFFELLNDDQDK